MHVNCFHSLVSTNKEYLSEAVTVLRKGFKNFDVTKSYFCYSIIFTVITQDDKGVLIKTESAFRPFTMSTVERSSQTRAFRHLSKDVFRGR